VPPVSPRPRRVAIVQRALRRYRADLYDRLRADLEQDGIELQVFHSTLPPHLDARDDALDLPWGRHLRRRVLRLGHRHLVWQPLVPELRTADLVIVEQASQLVLNYRLLLRQVGGGPRVAFWGHGRSFAAERSSVGEWVKRRVSCLAHWWFAYTARSAGVLADLGFPPERITVVDNAIDTAGLRRALDAVEPGELAELRRELGAGAGSVGLFLGALREDKQLDVLFAAAERIHRVHPDFHLVVVGSGPMEATVREVAAGVPWLTYLGPRYDRDRAAVLALADVLLIPDAVGLAVLDSFVSATPLITARDGAHGPEIAYLRHRENGLLVDAGADPARYADAVLEVLGDHALAARLRDGCRADAERYSIQAMAARFAGGIRLALDAPRRRAVASWGRISTRRCDRGRSRAPRPGSGAGS
jgi:L-malate glycosyltransferase